MNMRPVLAPWFAPMLASGLALFLAAACRSAGEEFVSTPADASAAKNQENPGPQANLDAPPPVEPVSTLSAGAPASRRSVETPVADGLVHAELGQPAPDFRLKDLDGREHRLSSYRGKIVVLEWFNPACPFVQYAYDKGPMRDMRERYATTGIVWLGINSGAPGMQGADVLENKEFLAKYAIKTPLLIDSSGVVGRSYGAKTTPHMFVINERGVLVYRGGLDNAQLGKVEGSAAKVNYVDAALTDLKSGHGVTTSDTKSYGCSVKYGK